MIKGAIIMIISTPITEKEEEKEWENPLNPEAPTDSRDKQQAQRLYEEAKRQKENLTDTEEPTKQ